MLMQFAKGQRRTLKELRAAVEEEDGDESRRLAHSIAGAAGNLSMHELRRLAKTVELALKFQQGDLRGMLDELEREAARVLEGIDLLAELRKPSAPPPNAAPVMAPSEPSPGDATVMSAAERVALENLVKALEDGELDAIQRVMESLRGLSLTSGSVAALPGIEGSIEAFDHAEAARMARRLLGGG
ncbi:MAG: Hpt domain-containing protein [Verrucomicrobiales bacterium]|nr:Hpt domain-containing protein [Verrucomicrobiales bacterium]